MKNKCNICDDGKLTDILYKENKRLWLKIKQAKQEKAKEIKKDIDKWIKTFYGYSSEDEQAEAFEEFQDLKNILKKHVNEGKE